MPPGEPVPTDGSLPVSALARQGKVPLGLYVHVPYCASRCGYCDFNTYTAAELGAKPGTGQDAYLAAAAAEMDLALRVLGDPPRLQTVFFGGGTPVLLPAVELVGLLARARDRFGLAEGAEVTTEANPEAVDQPYLDQLVAGGFNRLSIGMQSASSKVLSVLDRRHTPGRVAETVAWARAAGFSSVSLDLIYGSPTESLTEWESSLRSAIEIGPDHLSVYSLTVEPGTRLAARVARGELPGVDQDFQADCFLLAQQILTEAGYAAYEVSNWARPGHQARHNLGYWRSHNWWGVGPGAHSHVNGVRWWNLRHPRDYTERLAAGLSPAQAREVLTEAERRVERVMLELRLAEGLPLGVLTETERARLPALLADRRVLIDGDRLVLTAGERVVADALIRDLLD